MVFKRIGMFSLLLLLFACGSTNKVRVTTTKAEQEAKDKALAASQTKSNTTAETKTASGESLEATSKVNTTLSKVMPMAWPTPCFRLLFSNRECNTKKSKTYIIPGSLPYQALASLLLLFPERLSLNT